MLKYAILELLSRRPLTGYELKKRFDASIIFFWHAEHSQIYGELKRMRKDEVVVFTVEQQDGRPNRKVYAITEKGLAELRAWLAEPVDLPQLKDEILLKTFAFDLIDPETARQQLLNYRHLCEERLETYASIWEKLLQRHGPIEEVTHPGLFCSYLTLTQGMMYERMFREWCTWASDQFQHLAANASRHPKHHDGQSIELSLYGPPERSLS